ncbi:TetR/AcrR family transcriptional regulator [Cryptosporangium sp. NPDC048952]|uniref:TetR/AcrR family transcriptional regulator n=1 Tax=Cryptosporangium sp. NPDC048952 TaxID=3363961 RepID=UPI00371BCC78
MVIDSPQAPTAERSRRSVETRAKLVSAARAVFEARGVAEARVAQISELAGLSYGSFYHYFDSKDAVFREVAASVAEALTAGMATIQDRESASTPRARLSAGIRVHFEAFRREARMLSVIDQAARADPEIRRFWAELLEPSGRDVVEGIAQLQRHGLVDADLDVEIAAAALGAMTWRFAEQWFVYGEPDLDFDTGVQQFTRLYFNALRLSG